MTEHDISMVRDVSALQADMRTVKHDLAQVSTKIDALGVQIAKLNVKQERARPLRLAMTELPRLNALRRLGIVDDPLLGMPVHHRVFDRDVRDGRVPERREQFGAFVELAPPFGAGAARRRH